ncbi:MAG: histidine--tRNA ligase [Alphaproteobacteria bacterium]|nr:histidine--tRNA ligase [Alphaproteobacteria bacterium]
MADRPTRRPRAENPKGFRDYFGAEVTERKAMLDRIAAVYQRHGFDPLETPAIETVEALGKFLPDVDRPNEGVFAWQEGSDWLALRYDLTAPLARVAAQYRAELPSPYRRYAMGPVWRNEKPGPGRFRQFYQCDADTVGAGSVAADAEICAMLCEALEAVGIARGDYVIRINNRKVLNGVLEVAGLLDPADPARMAAERGIVLRAIDKIDRLGEAGVRALLGEGRRDESGDFTRGAGLGPEAVAVVMGFVNAFSIVNDRLFNEASNARDEGDLARFEKLDEARRAPLPEFRDTPNYSMNVDALKIWTTRVLDYLQDITRPSSIGFEGVEELRQISDLLIAQGFGPDRAQIDPSVVRGLSYYTGPVFEAELTFEVTDEKGRRQQFGSVAGGGRYDDLVERFTGQKVPATGVSIGVDRLLAALRARGAGAGVAEPLAVVTVMDRERMADYMKMAAELRGEGLRAEVYLGNPKNFGNQMKYADRRGAAVAIIAGSDEAARDVVQVKDLVAGAAIAAGASLEDWKARPAQVEVARADLVAAVRRIIGR